MTRQKSNEGPEGSDRLEDKQKRDAEEREPMGRWPEAEPLSRPLTSVPLSKPLDKPNMRK
jgi:hypothetical protein